MHPLQRDGEALVFARCDQDLLQSFSEHFELLNARPVGARIEDELTCAVDFLARDVPQGAAEMEPVFERMQDGRVILAGIHWLTARGRQVEHA